MRSPALKDISAGPNLIALFRSAQHLLNGFSCYSPSLKLERRVLGDDEFLERLGHEGLPRHHEEHGVEEALFIALLRVKNRDGVRQSDEVWDWIPIGRQQSA